MLVSIAKKYFFLHLVKNTGFAFGARSVHKLLVEEAFLVHLICLKLYICSF